MCFLSKIKKSKYNKTTQFCECVMNVLINVFFLLYIKRIKIQEANSAMHKIIYNINNQFFFIKLFCTERDNFVQNKTV